MKVILFSIFFISCLTSNLFSNSYEWTKTFGSKNEDLVSRITFDQHGNILVVGTFISEMNFGEYKISSYTDNFPDAFIAKFSPNGTLMWAKNIGGEYNDYGFQVVVDNNNNIFVGGNGNGKIYYDNIECDGHGSFFIKLSQDGEFLWFKSKELEGNAFNDLQIDPMNNVFFVGFRDGGGGLTIFKFDPNGISFKTLHLEYANTNYRGEFRQLISFDAKGNFYINLLTEPYVIINGKKYNGNLDIILAKFDNDFNSLWVRQIGSPEIEWPHGFITDKNGNIFLSGTFSNEVDFGGTTLNSASSEFFFAKYDTDGNLISVKKTPNQFCFIAINHSELYLIECSNNRLFVNDHDGNEKNIYQISSLSSVDINDCGVSIITGSFTDEIIMDTTKYTSKGKKDIYLGQLIRNEYYPLNQPSLSFPATNTSGHNLISQLGWFGVGCASSYQIQISKDENFNQIIFDKNNISNYSIYSDSLEYLTQYFWKVRAFSSDTLSEWSETWSFTTVKPEPDLVSLIYPTNNSTNIEKQLTLTWDLTPRATKYFLQVSKDIDFAEKVISNANIVENKFQVDFEFETQYYWKVAAANSFGASEWSDIWSFKVRPDKPAIPENLTPLNNSVDEPINTLFTWSVLNGVYYNLQISQDEDFIFKEYDLEVSDSRWKGMLEKNTVYFWRIKAINSYESGDWSDVWSFKTGTTVGVKDVLMSDLKVYTDGNELVVELPNNWDFQTGQLYYTIHNLLGQKILTEYVNYGNSFIRIDSNKLPKGTLMLSIMDKDRVLITKKLLLVD